MDNPNHSNQWEKRKVRISEFFPESEFTQFREYCRSSNIAFINELQPFDYVAFRSQTKADAEFVRQIRAKVESGKKADFLNSSALNEDEIVSIIKDTHPKNITRIPNTVTWEIALKETALNHMSTPLDGVNLSTRIRHRLMSVGITSVGKLLLTTHEQLKAIGYIGFNTREEIRLIAEELVRNHLAGNDDPPKISQEIKDKKSRLNKDLKINDQKHTKQVDLKNENNPELILGIYDKYSFRSLLILVIQKYQNSPLEILNLSIRAKNSLYRAGIKKASQVILADVEELLSVRNLGQMCLQEILEKKNLLIKNFITQNPDWRVQFKQLPYEVKQFLPLKYEPELFDMRNEFIQYLENLLNGNSNNDVVLELTQEEKFITDNLNYAIDTIGIDICKLAYQNPKEINHIIKCFRDFSLSLNKLATLEELYFTIPQSRYLVKLQPFISLYCQINKSSKDELSSIFSNCVFISDIAQNFNSICEYENQQIIQKFLKWLSIDINEFIKPILLKSVGEGNRHEILRRRAAGETLEIISQTFGVTRERIRQIESKAFEKYYGLHLLHPVLLAISAELNNKIVISSDDIRGVFHDADILLHFLKKYPDSNFEYDKRADCFYLSSTLNLKPCYDFINSLPKLFHENEYQEYLNIFSEKNNIPLDYVDIVFKREFQKTGTIWHSGKITPAKKYSYILEKYYPTGIDVYDHNDLARFADHVQTVFGENSNIGSDHAVSSIIQRIGILFDRGVYIHPSRVSIPDDLLRQIEKFFIKSGRTSMTFHELFEQFKEELLLIANINNRYQLQGLFKQHLGDKYYFYKDGISSDSNYKIAGEIETYIRENSPVSKQDLRNYFNGITEAMLIQNIARMPSIILVDDGMYIYADELDIPGEVQDSLRKVLKSITYVQPITASKLLEKLYSTHMDFLNVNKIYSPDTLFGILQYLFENEFAFSRPFISSKELGNMTRRDIVLFHLNGKKNVTINEIVSICEQNHIIVQNISDFIYGLQEDFLQADEDTLVSISRLLIDEEKLILIKKLLDESINHLGYKLFGKVENFIFYPDLGIPWSQYFLRSVIQKYLSYDFKVIKNNSFNNIMHDIIIDSRLGIDKYEEFIKWLIKSENNKEPFIDLSDVIKWLVKNGLINSKAIVKSENPQLIKPEVKLVDRYIPKFLQNGTFIFLDDFGKMIVS